MSWYYQNAIVETLPEECIGFVYCITNNITGRKYIGKKLAKFSKTTYKTVKLKNGNKKKKKIRSKIDSEFGSRASLEVKMHCVRRLGKLRNMPGFGNARSCEVLAKQAIQNAEIRSRSDGSFMVSSNVSITPKDIDFNHGNDPLSLVEQFEMYGSVFYEYVLSLCHRVKLWEKEGRFIFNKGPIFSNIVLIDEINRAPAKTQAALFEVMEERQITFDGVQYPMEFPFLVIATQNPIEQEGTYSLPEAQLDRFIFKIKMDYPSLEEEAHILTRYKAANGPIDMDRITPLFSSEDIKRVHTLMQEMVVEASLINYIAAITHRTRSHAKLYLGASPRASLSM